MAQPGSMLQLGDLDLGHEEEEPLDVLDLPQLYTKPPSTTLLATLADLASEPPSWDTTPRSTSGVSTPLRRRKRKVRSEGVPAYLTKIIASPLAWIECDAEKERVWEAAAQRLSERSGRAGMGAVSRTFAIPLGVPVIHADADGGGGGGGDTEHPVPAEAEDEEEEDEEEDILHITLHEPALTADNLGLKTWAASYLLAKRLVSLRAQLPPFPFPLPSRIDGIARIAGAHPPSTMRVQVLELGAGTGLVGLAAAAILPADVWLTDLPEIVPNLERNARANAVGIAGLGGGEVRTGVLDWGQPGAFPSSPHGGDDDDAGPANSSRIAEHSDSDSHAHSHPHSFPLILAADPLYSPAHPRLLVRAIGHHLARRRDARVVVEMPVREAYAAERADFRARMGGLGLRVVGEGEEVGFDDWAASGIGGGDGEGELAEVRCWWSVWGWR
ncbi:hypothetical protein LTR36_006147 [Oleoguttula mirabilis]|uniref:Uncharacterized protein n=1 Tax=Oleoguttula mirabilis TaxID=1507867 RepID=A0AAV9JCA4_9PEZI|nr:hypothetical protein LTR36_006147 [Oleoguttula mirabilis]